MFTIVMACESLCDDGPEMFIPKIHVAWLGVAIQRGQVPMKLRELGKSHQKMSSPHSDCEPLNG